MNSPFIIIEPKVKKVPIIISVPHCGTEFPEELKGSYIESMEKHPDDTDWFVHNLYDFASEYGITLIIIGTFFTFGSMIMKGEFISQYLYCKS